MPEDEGLDQDFTLKSIHAELQETNHLLRLLAEQMAATYANADKVLRKYDQS